MVDVNPLIVDKLGEIGLPVYADINLDGSKKAPCLSYYEYDNVGDIEGDIVAYSRITYKVKVWSKDLQELVQNACLVDEKMHELGFKRTTFNDLWFNNLGCRELKYVHLARETF